MLGENAVRFLTLDHDRLADIAKRIGPSIEDVIGGDDPAVRPELVTNFDQHGGFLKPAEGEDRLPMVDSLLREDLKLVGVKR